MIVFYYFLSIAPPSSETGLKGLCAAHNSKIHCIFRSNKQDQKVKQTSKIPHSLYVVACYLQAEMTNAQQKIETPFNEEFCTQLEYRICHELEKSTDPELKGF